MKARSLEQLIGIKKAELYALEELLTLLPHDGCALEVLRPDLWVERLAQLVLLNDYAGQLPESFAALIRDAGVPPNHRWSQNLKNTEAFRADYLFEGQRPHPPGWDVLHPKMGAMLTVAAAIISKYTQPTD